MDKKNNYIVQLKYIKEGRTQYFGKNGLVDSKRSAQRFTFTKARKLAENLSKGECSAVAITDI